jgi:hypothetical protein
VTRSVVSVTQLVELLNDEEVAVRTAAFVCLVAMFELLGKAQAAMYLIIKRFVVADDEPTQLCIAQQFGPLILQVPRPTPPCVVHPERDAWRESLYSSVGCDGVFNSPATARRFAPNRST